MLYTRYMKFLIGTKNQQKVEIAHAVLAEFVKNTEFTLMGKDVPSGFGETPHDEETMQGAVNRAQTLYTDFDCDFGIGIESGLVERYGQIYEEAWCSVIGKDTSALGYSSGLKVPDIITNKMKSDDLEHFEVLRLEEIKDLLPIKTAKDTWANYSALAIARTVSFEESLRNALIQIFASKDSLYRK